MNDANVAANARLTIAASALASGQSLTFDGSAELDGHFAIHAGAGDDMLTGGARGDRFYVDGGGNDTVHGGGGGDSIYVGAALTDQDTIDGGTDADVLYFDGSYSNGYTVISGITNIETFDFTSPSDSFLSYLIKGVDANVAAGQTLTVVAENEANVIYDGTAETDGAFHFIIKGAGSSDGFEGGAGNDIYDNTVSTLQSSFYGNGGDDVANLGGNYSHGQIFGGSGYDTVNFDGDYTSQLSIGSSNFAQIEKIGFHGAHDYANVLIADLGNPSGSTIDVDASEMTSGGYLSLFLSGTSSHYNIISAAGGNSITAGVLSDTIDVSAAASATVYGRGGADTITGNIAGGDTFLYGPASDSTGSAHDIIFQANFTADSFNLASSISAIDTAVGSGTLSNASFDTDLANAVGAGQLAGHDAVLFTASAGDLSGHTFLVVDLNGTAGYQSGADLVIDVTGYTGTLTTGDFV
jgi:hypothetical protein